MGTLFVHWRFTTVLLLVLSLRVSASTQNDSILDDTLLFDGQFASGDYEYLQGLPLQKLVVLERKLKELQGMPFFNNSVTSEPESRDEHNYTPDTAHSGSEYYDHRDAYPLPYNMQTISDRRTSEDPWNKKPSKVQKIFQISITGLAFLAFAGYLLCMIVQAIKSKGTTYYHPSVTGTTTLSSVTKKRKPFMRRRRELSYITPLDEYGADRLEQMLVTFAESYVKATGS